MSQKLASALSRFNVLDLSRVRAGPTCVRQMSDWGANVIQVEMADTGKEGLGGTRDGSDWENLHRNKRSITLDLKTEKGMEVLKRLVEKADVLVENFRPDVKDRLGIDYESMRKVNKRLVYGSISGYGQTGPYAKRAGFDQIAQGMGGLMSITGLQGQGPVRAGIPVADLTTGIFCAYGILVALLEREVSGEGQWVQTSLLESQIFMLDYQSARWLLDKDIPQQAGNNHPTLTPTGLFETQDGHLNVATAGHHIWERLARVLGHEEWIEDPRYKTRPDRVKNREALNEDINKVMRTQPTEYWIPVLEKAGVATGPVYSIDQVFEDPQVKHLQLTRKLPSRTRGTVEFVRQPVSLSRTPAEMRTPTDQLGGHTDEILAEYGYSAEEIREMHASKVV